MNSTWPPEAVDLYSVIGICEILAYIPRAFRQEMPGELESFAEQILIEES
jgi:hypothetical protein